MASNAFFVDVMIANAGCSFETLEWFQLLGAELGGEKCELMHFVLNIKAPPLS